MSYFRLNADPRELQYGRLASNVLGSLRNAVAKRQAGGATRAAIAEQIGCDRSQLSRVLNGNVSNLTLRTISDILWATRHEPEAFKATAYEELSPNYQDAPPTRASTTGGFSKIAPLADAATFRVISQPTNQELQLYVREYAA